MFDIYIKDEFYDGSYERTYYKVTKIATQVSPTSSICRSRVIRYHRMYGPSNLEFDHTNRLVCCVWRKMGECHRLGGPAIMHWVYDHSKKEASGLDQRWLSRIRPGMLVEQVDKNTYIEYEFFLSGKTVPVGLIKSWASRCNITCLYNLTEQEATLFQLTFMGEPNEPHVW